MTERDPIAAAHQQWVAHGWSDAADGMALVTSITRAQQLLVERVENVLRPHGLTFARYEILRLLAFSRRRSMAMSRLGSLLQVHATSVTSAVDRLEKQGLVERLRLERDRRVVLASLTTKGADLVDAATTDLNARVFTSPGLDPAQVTAATELLTSLRAAHGDVVADRLNTEPTAAQANGDTARLRELGPTRRVGGTSDQGPCAC